MAKPQNFALTTAISNHIEREIGPINLVFHELHSDDLHIDVHHVAPTQRRPFHTLVTTGMSEFPMDTGPEATEFRYAELSILLPPRWDLRTQSLRNENNYWPLRLLKTLARLPFQSDDWLGDGHTVAVDDPPEPYASGTELCSCILLPPLTLGERFFTMPSGDGALIHFWSVVPLYSDELEFKFCAGAEALVEALRRAGVSDVVDPRRPHVHVR